VLAEADLVERLRDGATREEVARGCLYAAAERVLELGKLRPPLAATGGVAASFPGVVEILAERLGQELTVVPEPILAGARGAALLGLGLGTGARGEAADGAPSEAP